MNEEMQSMGGRRYQKRVIGVWNWKYAVACRNCRWWIVWWLGKFLTLFKQELLAAAAFAILSNLVKRYVDKWISMRWCYLLHRLLSSPFNVYHLNFLSDFAISAPPQRAARGGRSSQSFRFSFEHEAMYEQKLQLSNHRRRRRRRHHHYTTVFCIYWILTSADGVLLSPPPHTHTIIWRRQGLSVTGRIYGKWVRCWCWCWCYWQRRWWCYGWYLALHRGMDSPSYPPNRAKLYIHPFIRRTTGSDWNHLLSFDCCIDLTQSTCYPSITSQLNNEKILLTHSQQILVTCM